MKEGWMVYILECADGTLYTGITDNIDKRLATHNAGKGAKYTRGRGPVSVRYMECCESKGAALHREYVIKSLPRAEKLALIKAYSME